MGKKFNSINALGDKYAYYNKNITNSVKEDLNTEMYRIFSNLYDIACSRFIWEGLPPSIESRYIEEFIVNYGEVMFTKDEVLGLICLPCQGQGDLNIYGEYTKYRLLQHGGEPLNTVVYPLIRGQESPMINKIHEKEGTKPQYGVLLKASNNDMPFIENVKYYTKLLYDFKLSYSMNLQQQRFTNIIPTNEMNELSIRRILGKIYDYEPFVMVDESEVENIQNGYKTIDTGIKYLLSNLWEDEQRVFSDYLTLCGINNNPNVKKERMITDEVNSNNEFIEYMINRELTIRQECAKYLTKLNEGNIVTVKRLKDFNLGGVINGNTHNQTISNREG